MVLDASSSLRRGGHATRQTEESYIDVMEQIAGLMCRGERMVVYPVVRDEQIRLLPVDSVLAEDVSRARLRGLAQQALGRDPGHSDILLLVDRTREAVFSRSGTRAVFVVTDGSFYPHRVPARRDWRLQAVMDRLTDLDRLVPRLRQDSIPWYVVGLRADRVPAVDPELAVIWPDSAGRAWAHGAESLDLREMSGDSLLAEVFGAAYVRQERLDLWKLMIGAPGSPWQRLLDYSNGWARGLAELRAVRMEHLMFVPEDGGGPDACARVRYGPRAEDAPPPVQPVRVGPNRRFACSLERPTPPEIDSIVARGVAAYAFRQTPRFHPLEDPAPLYGLHEFILSADATPCPDWTLSRDALQSRRPGGPAVGLLEVVPIGGERVNDTVSMVQHRSSPCIVPNVSLDTAGGRQGEYLLFVSDTGGEWVHRRQFQVPKLRLASVDYRPGGFPFPPGRLVLLGVCIHSTAPMRPGEKLVVELDTALHELARAQREDCPQPRAGSQRSHVYGFRGVVLLESTNLASARVGIAPGGESASIPYRGGWLPVPLVPNGTWFLSRGCLIGSALLGALVQMGYLWFFAGVRLANLRRMRRLLSVALSVFISAMLMVIFTEFCVMVNESPLHSSSIPIPFGMVVFGHALKLLAAALVPELVEDALLTD